MRKCRKSSFGKKNMKNGEFLVKQGYEGASVEMAAGEKGVGGEAYGESTIP